MPGIGASRTRGAEGRTTLRMSISALVSDQATIAGAAPQHDRQGVRSRSAGRLDLHWTVSDAPHVGILSAIKAWFVAPRRNDFYGVAKKSRRVPPAELAVAEVALEGGGPIAERLARQLREAPDVWRLISDDGTYDLRVSTSIEVRGVPRAGWRSRPIPVHAGERALEITLDVSPAGIIEILGRTLDGLPWPAAWQVQEAELDAIRTAAPWIALPTPTQVREQRARAVEVIEAWLGEPGLLDGTRGMVAADPPATPEAIAAFEQTHSFLLPAAYRDLVLVADGIEVGSFVLLGTNDAYRLDIAGSDRLVITPPNEDGAFVLALNGEVRFVELEDATSDGRLRASDLREWVRKRVRPRPTS